MLVLSRWWFHIFFYFHPLPGEMIQFDKYFSNGLKPPTTLLTYFDFYRWVVNASDWWTCRKKPSQHGSGHVFVFFWSIFQLDARMTVWQWKTRRFVFCLLRIVYIVCINVKYFIAQRDSPFIFGFCVTPTANSIEFGSCNSNLGWLYYCFFCLIPLCKSLCNFEHPCLFGSLRPG